MSNRIFRFDLATTLLTLAATGAWCAYFANHSRLEEVERANRQLAELAEEVYVAVPGQSAVISRTAAAMTDREWEVYLAPGAEYQWQIATRAIPADGVAASQGRDALAPGRHRLLVRQVRRDDGTQLTTRLYVDGRRVFESTDKPVPPVAQQMQVQAHVLTRTQRPLGFGSNQPLIAFRYFVQAPDSPQPTAPASILPESSPGLVLWLEPK